MPALSTLVSEARDTTHDLEVPYRVSDAKMTEYANAFVRELALLRPDLFSTVGDITCTAGTCLQVAPSGAIAPMAVFQVKAGRVVTEANRGQFDRFNSN